MKKQFVVILIAIFALGTATVSAVDVIKERYMNIVRAINILIPLS